MKAQAGHFYAVGIGPGAPDLLTLRAVDIIKSAKMIIAPRAETSDASLALSAIRPYTGIGQEIVEHIYPMKRDNEATLASWDGVAEKVCAALSAGKSVAQITLGDPLIYSTSAYLLECLSGRLEPGRIHVVPGISAFQASAARLNKLLCLQEDRMLIMPGTHVRLVEQSLSKCETLVLFKAGKNLGAIREMLKKRGLLEQASAAFYVEQEGEAIWRSMAEEFDHAGKYMTIVIIRTGRRTW